MSSSPSDVYEFGQYRLDVGRRVFVREGHVVPLAPKTFELLLLLVQTPGRAFSKQELMRALWPDTFVEEANLSFQISVLRKALGDDGSRWIETVPKHGYRFAVGVRAIPGVGQQSATPSANVAAAMPWALNTVASRKRSIAIIVGASVLVAISYKAFSRAPRPASVGRPSAIAVPLTAYEGAQDDPSFSPDGSQIAFAWNGPAKDNRDIYVKLVGPGEPLRLTTHPAPDSSAAWSPDGRLIAFQRPAPGFGADIFVIPALGGAERKVATISLRAGDMLNQAPLASARNLSWTPDSKWIAFGGRRSQDEAPGIWLVAVERPEMRRLTETSGNSVGDWEPAVSRSGRHLAFVRQVSRSNSGVYVLPLSPAFTAAGAPISIIRDVITIGGIAWTPDDTALVFSAGSHNNVFTRLYRILVELNGSERETRPELLAFGEQATHVSISKTGRLVYAKPFRDANIWKVSLAGQDRLDEVPLVRSTFDELTPDYSPDGKRLAFTSTRSGAEEIWVSNADGSNPVQLTSMGGPLCANPRWSPDGRTILFNSRREGSADLYLLRPDNGDLRRITDDPAEEVEPRWSRDGRTIYFGSNRTGRFEVWKMPASGGAAARITQNGGLTATESPDGRFIYYAKQEIQPTSIWRVPVGGGEERPIAQRLSWSQNFVVADRGLYFLAPGDVPQTASIEFYEYATEKRTTLLQLGKRSGVGMGLSPDQQWLLYTVIDSVGSNLMLVNTFQ